MLRGNAPATIDSKGRLKVPTKFRRRIEQKHGNAFFITSIDGDGVRIYPLPVWEAFEARIATRPSFNRSIARLVDLLSYYGAEAQMDKQGRVLIHPHLREAAGTTGEVDVLGKHDHLEVWNKQRFWKHLEENPLSDADHRELSDLGL